MNNSHDSAHPEFWDVRYQKQRTPWDLGGIPSCLTKYLQTRSRPGRVLIPGCGSGYEVKAFAELGWDVMALDFSAAAVQRSRGLLGPLAECVVQGDFFAHEFEHGGFDLIYERTFLCALSPTRWTAYAVRVASLLKVGGALAGVFFYGHEDDPPPYPLTEGQARALFGKSFVRTCDEGVADSLPTFSGGERWQVWQRQES